MKSKVTDQRWKLVTLLLFLLQLGVIGCRPKSRNLQTPQWVKTAEVVACTGMDTVTYPGKLKAVESVKLAFRVAGPLKKVHVREGDQVKKGELLAELDPRDYRLQYDAAQAEYVQVKEETDRIIELYRRGSVAVNEYDKAISAQKRAAVQFQAAQNELDDTRLKAPFDGYIQHSYFTAPELVNQGTPVLAMQNDRLLEVEVELSARDFLRRSDVVASSVVTDVNPAISYPLELMGIQTGANYNQLFSAHFRLKESLSSGLSPDIVSGLMPDLPFGLAPGLSVTVTICFLSEQDQLAVIPISALFQRRDSSFVWCYDPQTQKVHAEKIQVESVWKNGSARVKSSLQPGQLIISAGVQSLHEGETVKLLPSPSSSNVGGVL